jgi:hypothetical protein
MAGIEKLISGAQTGADRAALDAALEFGIPHGGWCPAGRLAEDGDCLPWTDCGLSGRVKSMAVSPFGAHDDLP